MSHEADYLVVGAGAMAMAFVDALITESDATVVMVDRYHQPGGHWTTAYPFVRLHQPSSFYGVNSKKMGSDAIDQQGWNEGLYELATNSEVVAYFDQVMHQQFLPSGRVQYLPRCEYLGDGRVRSILSGDELEVSANKLVDSTYMNVTVPSMRPPPFVVDAQCTCVAPNALVRGDGDAERFVVIGAGKTGMDACLFLLSRQVAPDRITWIMPRDSWCLDRANIQSNDLFMESIGRGFAETLAAIAESESTDDVFRRVEAAGQLVRIDQAVTPTMYRCATVTQKELRALRTIKDVVRLGRVREIRSDALVLDGGEITTSPANLHIDCTADGLERRPVLPVFDGTRINLQSLRTCQQVFSAALVGHVEATYDDAGIKNDICTPVPHPDDHMDFLRTTLADLANEARWSEDDALREWVDSSRLNAFAFPGTPNEQQAAALAEMMSVAPAAAEKLQGYIGGGDGQPG